MYNLCIILGRYMSGVHPFLTMDKPFMGEREEGGIRGAQHSKSTILFSKINRIILQYYQFNSKQLFLLCQDLPRLFMRLGRSRIKLDYAAW